MWHNSKLTKDKNHLCLTEDGWLLNDLLLPTRDEQTAIRAADVFHNTGTDWLVMEVKDGENTLVWAYPLWFLNGESTGCKLLSLAKEKLPWTMLIWGFYYMATHKDTLYYLTKRPGCSWCLWESGNPNHLGLFEDKNEATVWLRINK